MIWKKCILLETVKISDDELGNPVCSRKEIAETKARATPWTDEQIALEGRDITRNEQQYIIPIPFRQFPSKCDRVQVEGHELNITQISELSPRWTAIRVKICKEKGNANN